jgi:flagellar hook-basal body complex protein FliE
MNPLDALSALTSAVPTSGINFQPTGPTVPTAPVTESFQNVLNPTTGSLTVPDISSPSVGSISSGSPTTWGHMAQQMVMDVNAKQQNAAAMVTDVLKGGPTQVHDAMIASEEASLSFQFLSEVRNKVVDAYQQVMQMQV